MLAVVVLAVGLVFGLAVAVAAAAPPLVALVGSLAAAVAVDLAAVALGAVLPAMAAAVVVVVVVGNLQRPLSSNNILFVGVKFVSGV